VGSHLGAATGELERAIGIVVDDAVSERLDMPVYAPGAVAVMDNARLGRRSRQKTGGHWRGAVWIRNERDAAR
jgi:hypothetical protein